MSTENTVNPEPDAVSPDAVKRDSAGTDQPGVVAFRVVSGHPTPQEIAAVVTVLSALSTRAAQGHSSPAASAGSAWSDPGWRLVGPSRDHGGWRTAALPR